LRVQRKRDLLTVDGEALGVDFLDGEARAVLVVLAEVGRTARERTDVADLDDLVCVCVGRECREGNNCCAHRQQRVKLERH
jgi:hypothetical protein